MIPRFSPFVRQKVGPVSAQCLQATQLLRMIDGKPGDQNPNPDAISIQASQGQLDAVVFSKPDGSQTLVQRLNQGAGQTVLSWVDLPPRRLGPQDFRPV
jgi:hypothetical protein